MRVAWRLALIVSLLALALLAACAGADSRAEDATVPELRPAPLVESDTASLTPQPMSSDASAQTSLLLDTYDLHPAGEAVLVSQSVLASGDPEAALYLEASYAIGLDLSARFGEEAQWFAVTLEEKQRSGPRPASACFIVVGDDVVGAALILDAYYPGVFALSDHSELVADTER